ncbi:hypothetical protein [Streptococcus intermedius]
MDQYEMMDQEIRSKQHRLDEARETYQRSCKVLERKYDESRSKQNQLHQILEKSHSLFKHLLDEEEGDKTELTYQLNTIASNYSEQFNMAYRNRQRQLDQEWSQMEQAYKKERSNLEEELAQAQYQRRRLEQERGER